MARPEPAPRRSNGQYDYDKKGGCFIATAVYGSYEAPEVLVLRRFRDNVLSKTSAGRIFIQFYYSTSPAIAERLRRTPIAASLVKRFLDKIVKRVANRL